jgi:hypothetical protein
MGRRLGRSYSLALREGVASGRNRPGKPSRPGLRRPLRRPFGAPGSADAIAGTACTRPLCTVTRRSLPDLWLPGHRKPLTRARSAATRPLPKPSHTPSLTSNPLHRRKPVPTAKVDPGLRRESAEGTSSCINRMNLCARLRVRSSAPACDTTTASPEWSASFGQWRATLSLALRP